jgi:D-serine dehydratase
LHPTTLDRAAVAASSTAVAPRWKGSPLGPARSLRELAGSGLDALDGSLPFPLLLLREDALAHNIERMARFARDERVLLAPHAKTTMSPEIVARQIDAGCWAVTVATPSQMQALRSVGVQRLLLANQLVEPGVIHWVARERRDDPPFEVICLVDSAAGIEILDRELRAAGSERPVAVLLEVGPRGGRCGVRTLEDARAVAQTAHDAPLVELVGVECFEGLTMDPDAVASTLAAVDDHLAFTEAIAEDLHGRGLLASRFVSAGGSAYFDRVLQRFPRPAWRVALRSGCYVSQDGGFYEQVSPLAGRGSDPSPLQDAIEAWAVVLSRPEPDVAVVGLGKRDAPFDITPPRAVAWREAGASAHERPLGADVLRLNDQHITIALHESSGPAVGDLVRFAVSHPCGAFDRWRVIPLVDPGRRIVGAVQTLF